MRAPLAKEGLLLPLTASIAASLSFTGASLAPLVPFTVSVAARYWRRRLVGCEGLVARSHSFQGRRVGASEGAELMISQLEECCLLISLAFSVPLPRCL